MSITVGTGRTCGGIVILVVADHYGFARGCAKPLDRVLPLQVRLRASNADPNEKNSSDNHLKRDFFYDQSADRNRNYGM
jgi:hypothetical protein